MWQANSQGAPKMPSCKCAPPVWCPITLSMMGVGWLSPLRSDQITCHRWQKLADVMKTPDQSDLTSIKRKITLGGPDLIRDPFKTGLRPSWAQTLEPTELVLSSLPVFLGLVLKKQVAVSSATARKCTLPTTTWAGKRTQFQMSPQTWWTPWCGCMRPWTENSA